MSNQADPSDRSVPSGQASLGPLYEPWQVVSTLASEYGHAVRHAFGNDRDVITSGDVHHERKLQPPARISTDQLGSLKTFEQNEHLLDQQSGKDTLWEKSFLTESAVQAEALRVSTRIAALDAAKKVFLRFDFMSERDSRVCKSSCFVALNSL